MARIFVGLELKDAIADRAQLLDDLKAADYATTDLTDNEVAKLHVRHLAGGVTTEVANERLYRFEFPERRGALLRFLQSVGVEWDITLFHYLNHGSDYGRVLVGVDAPPETLTDLETHLEQLGYHFWDETDNEAYTLFLR